MKKPKYIPTQQEVKEHFDYNPKTGILTRKKNGKITGSIKRTKYGGIESLSTNIGYDQFLLHKIIWLWYYGYYPIKRIDHIDRNPANNKINNLREISPRGNCINSNVVINKSSGIRGVIWNKRFKSWRVQIKNRKKRIYIGNYKKFDNAVITRVRAEYKYGWWKYNKESSAYLYAKKYLSHRILIKRNI